MEALVFERAARFLIGAPHPTVSAEAFARTVLEDLGVRQVLRNSRWRLLHVTTEEEHDKRAGRDVCRECEALFYDYSRNRTVRVRGLPGQRLRVSYSREQPVPSAEEFQEALELAAKHPVWGPLIQAGHVAAYDPMPPIREPEGGEEVERTLYIGLVSRPRQFNRIIAVNMVRREVSHEPVTPRYSMAAERACGPTPSLCNRPYRGTAGKVTIEWPSADPVWTLQAIRPTASSGKNGSGLELRSVFYRGKKVFQQAHVPILNVRYDNDACGPFRDWLWSETCFDASGDDIPGARGFRWCTRSPETIYETGQDGGGFVGVAIFEDTDNLCLMSQCAAGWYRYVMEWRLYLDGRIEPRFKFGGVANSCVCNLHHHHALWRFDFDIRGNNNVVEELDGSTWTPLRKETSRRRQVGQELRWRVMSEDGACGYEIVPGDHDGIGDNFSGMDQYLLKYRSGEIDDGQRTVGGKYNVRLDKFMRGENVYKKDLVVWYGAHFDHDVNDEDEHDHIVGPSLVPVNWPT